MGLRKIKVGVVGAGMWGNLHMECLLSDDRVELTWVCSKTTNSVNQAMDKYRIKNGSIHYDEMLSDPSLDAVIVSTPPFTHAEITVAALKMGKHVLIEKPMVANTEQIQRILSEAALYPNLIVLDASCRSSRLQPKFGFVKKIIDDGKLGDIYYIHHNRLSRTTFIEYNPQGAWAVDKTFAGGGPFIDLGVYDLSFHLGILGDIPNLVSMRSFTVNDLRDMKHMVDKTDIEQHGAAWMEFDTGLRYYYEIGGGVHLECPYETRIYGTKGGIRLFYLTADSNIVEYYHEEKGGKLCKDILTIDMSNHPSVNNIPLIKHFLDCIEKKDSPIMPPNLAARYLEILFKIVNSTNNLK
jgi:predicted dehydrogenase